MIIPHPFYTMVLPHPFLQVICSSNLIVGYIVVVVIDNQLVKLYESEYWDFSEFSHLITSTWALCIGQKQFVSMGFMAACDDNSIGFNSRMRLDFVVLDV